MKNSYNIIKESYRKVHCGSFQFVEKVCIYKNRAHSLSLSERVVGFASCKAFGRSIPASLPKPQAPSPREGAECGAAALTKHGRLKSVAHSRCTTQRHQRLTTRIGATPKARTLWLLAKSFARCKTNIASNAKHQFSKII